MSEAGKLYIKLLRRLNEKNKGAIIYTGNPEFNEVYLSTRIATNAPLAALSGKRIMKTMPNLATKEQELALQADLYKDYADAGLPELKKYFTRKAVNRNNARKPRKQKPTRVELEAFETKHVCAQGHSRGWKKAAMREFNITYNTLNAIHKQ